MNMITHEQIQKGSVVQFRSDWGQAPTPGNTSLVTRVAKNRIWADVNTPFGNKRIPYPDRNLKLITDPLVVVFPKIPVFEWKDLHGKLLEIVVMEAQNENKRVTFGKDHETDKMYVIKMEDLQ